MEAQETLLRTVLGRFLVEADFISGRPHGTGHINDTFAVTCDLGGRRIRLLLQRLNTRIFLKPAELMRNIEAVTSHIRRKLEALGLPCSRRVLTLVQAREGGTPYVDDPVLGFWRCYVFIEGARTFDVIESPSQAFQAARAFGAFQGLLADYDGPPLHETIPAFHHTPGRLQRLLDAAARDPLGRAAGCAEDLAFARSRAPLAPVLADLQAAGAIPERITHNDTKLNNVMLDEETGEGVCVVDLDTVMPGLSLFDFGDMVRTACNPLAEDDPDVGGLEAREDMFMALAEGYLEGTGGALLAVERDLLVTAGQLLTYECGLRFLTDHLEGDTYFRIHRPGHNLDRARNQFALLRGLERQETGLRRRLSALPALAGGRS
ncbi:phosphotransferase enzyme family protein [Mesoterricola sediminis]|uniref:Mucin desulfatase n=1 Tax=Mesoterricola sediminis TaxID=2927980 RepID=A0AA48KBW6_9BACT|nr:aminoglycoside phosphotransferase family protein [Mesoterricola sediminis]BDU76534.1 mucin desulfatase [Mesoterricola sediminis]